MFLAVLLLSCYRPTSPTFLMTLEPRCTWPSCATRRHRVALRLRTRRHRVAWESTYAQLSGKVVPLDVTGWR